MTNLVQIRYIGSSCKYLKPFFSSPLLLKLRVVHIRKKFKISTFSKIALTILFKFCGFIVHSKPYNMILLAFPEKSLKLKKKKKSVWISPNVAPKPNDQSSWNSIYRVPLQISPFRSFFHFTLAVKIKGSSHKKKLNISFFSKVTPIILIKYCAFMVCTVRTFETQQNDTIDFSRKNPWN